MGDVAIDYLEEKAHQLAVLRNAIRDLYADGLIDDRFIDASMATSGHMNAALMELERLIEDVKAHRRPTR